MSDGGRGEKAKSSWMWKRRNNVGKKGEGKGKGEGENQSTHSKRKEAKEICRGRKQESLEKMVTVWILGGDICKIYCWKGKV